MQLNAKKLKLFLAENCMSQADLARACGITQAIVSFYLSGRNQPRLKTLGKIAKALNVPVMDLVTVTDEMEDNVS